MGKHLLYSRDKCPKYTCCIRWVYTAHVGLSYALNIVNENNKSRKHSRWVCVCALDVPHKGNILLHTKMYRIRNVFRKHISRALHLLKSCRDLKVSPNVSFVQFHHIQMMMPAHHMWMTNFHNAFSYAFFSSHIPPFNSIKLAPFCRVLILLFVGLSYLTTTPYTIHSRWIGNQRIIFPFKFFFSL